MRRRCPACINSRVGDTAYLNSEIDIPLKVVKFNLDAKKRKNMFVFLFLYNVDIVAFVLFVEIYKNISVAKRFLGSV